MLLASGLAFTSAARQAGTLAVTCKSHLVARVGSTLHRFGRRQAHKAGTVAASEASVPRHPARVASQQLRLGRCTKHRFDDWWCGGKKLYLCSAWSGASTAFELCNDHCLTCSEAQKTGGSRCCAPGFLFGTWRVARLDFVLRTVSHQGATSMLLHPGPA